MQSIIIIIVYFILIFSLGFFFRKRNKSSDDFFYGSGKMPWLWVGVSGFVSQFSASSFTIIASRAYTDGYSVLIIYWANALAFAIAALYFAAKLRQLSIASPVEAIRMRFGEKNEKIFVILSVPSYLIFPALWLNGIAVFISGAMGFDTTLIIVLVGFITVIISVLGGSWTIVSSDLIQFVIMVTLGIITSVVALGEIDGIFGLFENVSVNSIFPNDMNVIVFSFWVIYMLLQKFLSVNSVINSMRFNAVENSIAAKKAAWTTALIYIFGSFIWFIPVWVSSVFIPDLTSLYPNIKRPNMTAYLAFVELFMPASMLGVTLAALFAATMSSIDSSLNWATGFVSRSFHKNSNVRAPRIYTLIFGFFIIVMALYYENLKVTSLFELTYQLITYIYVPMTIPCILMLWVRKTPDWSFSFSIIIGFMLSFFLNSEDEFILYFINKLFVDFGFESLNARSVRTVSTFFALLAQIIITGGGFLVTTLFFNSYSGKRKIEVSDFYFRLNNVIPKLLNRPEWLNKTIKNIYFISVVVMVVILEFFFISYINISIFVNIILIFCLFIWLKKLK